MALGSDLFIEGRGQLGQLPSCGSERVVCEKPWELENFTGGEGQPHRSFAGSGELNI